MGRTDRLGPHTSRLSGGVPASGPEDYLLCSLLLFKNQPAFNHKSGDAEQRKSHPMSKRGDAAANPECTLAETCVPPCHQGPERQSQGHAPRQSAGSHLHTQCHPLYLCLLKCFPCLPGTSCACCLVSLPSSECPATLLSISSFFLVDLEESSLKP